MSLVVSKEVRGQPPIIGARRTHPRASRTKDPNTPRKYRNKPFSSNVITTLCPATQSYSKWIFQRRPGFKDSTRSLTRAFKAARQPSRHLEPTRAHRLRAHTILLLPSIPFSPLYSPQVETLLEQLDTKFDDMSSQIVDRSMFSSFATAVFCVILTCVVQWCRCRSAWMRSRLPFRISLTGTLLRVRRRAYRRRLVSQSRRLYRSALEVGCSDVFACPTRSTLSPVLIPRCC